MVMVACYFSLLWCRNNRLWWRLPELLPLLLIGEAGVFDSVNLACFCVCVCVCRRNRCVQATSVLSSWQVFIAFRYLARIEPPWPRVDYVFLTLSGSHYHQYNSRFRCGWQTNRNLTTGKFKLGCMRSHLAWFHHVSPVRRALCCSLGHNCPGVWPLR